MNDIDLHIHSCYSADGEYRPGALVQMCADAGIARMAIADHNCTKGVGEALEAAARVGIECVPAIEIDCTYDGVGLHVLGYGVAHDHPDFDAVERSVREQTAHASRALLRLVNGLGFALTEQTLSRLTRDNYWPEYWTGEVMAEALLNCDAYHNSELLAPYRLGGARGDNPYLNFYWDYCAQGKPCYVEITYPPIEHALELIHKHGGTAVLAHPGANLRGRFELIDAFIPMGLDGLEAFSSYHDAQTAAQLADIAARAGLAVTHGSDFHGKTKPAVKLGRCQS